MPRTCTWTRSLSSTTRRRSHQSIAQAWIPVCRVPRRSPCGNNKCGFYKRILQKIKKNQAFSNNNLSGLSSALMCSFVVAAAPQTAPEAEKFISQSLAHRLDGYWPPSLQIQGLGTNFATGVNPSPRRATDRPSKTHFLLRSDLSNFNTKLSTAKNFRNNNLQNLLFRNNNFDIKLKTFFSGSPHTGRY